MKKIYVPILLSILACIMYGCGKGNSESENIYVHENISTVSSAESTPMATDATTNIAVNTYVFDESKAVILDENDYINTPITVQTNYVTFYKKINEIKEAYPNLNIISINCPEGFIPNYIDEKGILYGNYIINNNSKIASYNYESHSINTIIENEGKSAIAMLSLEDNYIIYQKDNDYNWQSPEYHLYDLETKEDLMFYESVINPETGSAYCPIHFNYPIIIDHKLYYDDIIGVDGTGNRQRILYCYDIDNKTIKILYNDAALPNEYMHEISWFSLSSDGKTGVFCNEQGALYKPKALLGTTVVACDDIIAAHDNMSENTYSQLIKNKKINTNFDPLTGDPNDEATTSHGIKIVRNGVIEPILLTGNNVVAYATNISTNGRFVMWNGAYIGEPMFYDAKRDEIIKINFLNKTNGNNDTFYSFKASNNKLLLCYGSYTDNVSSYMIISLE